MSSFSYGEKPVIKDFTTTIMKGDRVGILGPNGSGQNPPSCACCWAELKPASGSIRLGTNLQIKLFRPVA